MAQQREKGENGDNKSFINAAILLSAAPIFSPPKDSHSHTHMCEQQHTAFFPPFLMHFLIFT